MITYAKPDILWVTRATVTISGPKQRCILPDSLTVGAPPTGWRLTIAAYETDE
jgi:hypothetical protein